MTAPVQSVITLWMQAESESPQSVFFAVFVAQGHACDALPAKQQQMHPIYKLNQMLTHAAADMSRAGGRQLRALLELLDCPCMDSSSRIILRKRLKSFQSVKQLLAHCTDVYKHSSEQVHAAVRAGLACVLLLWLDAVGQVDEALGSASRRGWLYGVLQKVQVWSVSEEQTIHLAREAALQRDRFATAPDDFRRSSRRAGHHQHGGGSSRREAVRSRTREPRRAHRRRQRDHPRRRADRGRPQERDAKRIRNASATERDAKRSRNASAPAKTPLEHKEPASPHVKKELPPPASTRVSEPSLDNSDSEASSEEAAPPQPPQQTPVQELILSKELTAQVHKLASLRAAGGPPLDSTETVQQLVQQALQNYADNESKDQVQQTARAMTEGHSGNCSSSRCPPEGRDKFPFHFPFSFPFDSPLSRGDTRSLDYNPYNSLHNPIYICIEVSTSFSIFFSI